MASILQTPSAVAGLAACHLEAPVEELAITRLTGDASTRSYFRAQARGSSVIVLRYSDAFDETERAVDRLTKLETANKSARLTFANDPCAHIEVTNLLIEAGLPVPRMLAVSGPDALMLIEDVGDVRLQDWLERCSQPETIEAYRHGLELIVKIQEATETALGADCICSHLAFDEAKLGWELDFFFTNYFNRYLGLRLDQTTSDAVQADFKALCSEIAACPRVLTHRDFHARNLMMHGGRMFIIDHQDARMGPASYDVASLLSDPYTTLPREAVADLVENFIEMKSKSKFPLENVGEFRTELELMTAQRMLKAIGTYSSQAAAGNPVYVSYIEPALERALAPIRNLRRFEPTRALLETSCV